MPLPNGIYMISSVNPEAGHLDLAPYTVPIFPPMYFIVGSLRRDLKEQWRVTSVGGNKYTIHSTTHPRAAWAIRATTVVASEGQVDEFSIEPAGEGTHRIHVPNEDLVATLERAGHEQLHVDPANGSDSQRWRFVRIFPE